MKKMYYLFYGRVATFKTFNLLAALLLLCTLGHSQGTSALACNDLVQVSLDDQCEAQITPDMILAGTYTPMSQFSVSIQGVQGDVVTQLGTYKVTVTSSITNIYCWGNILVEDKLAPQLENCPCEQGSTDPACRFFCSDQTAILNGTKPVPTPTVVENCSTFITLKSDHVIDNGCNGKTIVRTWSFKDQSGNTSDTCISYYTLAPLNIANVTPPVNKFEMPCGIVPTMQAIYDYYTPLVGAALALTYAYPTVNGQIISNEGPCNIIATKSDSKVLVCGDQCTSSFKTLRTWSVIDWCTNQTYTFVQVIDSKDKIAPTISAVNINSNVNPWNCAADIIFPAPTSLTDNCDPNPTYAVTGPVGVVITFDSVLKRYRADNVPKGVHTFVYRAKDCCDNQGITNITVTVRDEASPVAISKEYIVVSLTKQNGNDGIAKIFPASVDNGSHDGCTPVHLEIRRDTGLCGHDGNITYNNDGHPFDKPSDPDGGNFVKFCCSDLTSISPDGIPFGTVKVWLRVWDDANMSGKYGDVVNGHSDNYNETWTNVRVEDKLSPTIKCPNNITIECNQDPYDLTLTGRATATFTCANGNVVYTDTDTLNSCGFGTIDRRWSIQGLPGVFCMQKITIKEGNFFNPQSIVWPIDETLSCTDSRDYKVTWTDADCSLIGVAVKSDTFQFVEDVCFKVVNTYTVVDWCRYHPNINPNVGIYKHTQILKIYDNTAPTISCRDTMFVASDPSDSDGDGNTCEYRGLSLQNTAVDEGTCASKVLKWQVFVDLYGDGTSEFEYSSFLPSNDNTFNDSNNNGVKDIYLAPSVSGQKIMITIPDDIAGSMSNHKITWKVTDGCGNYKSCTTNVMVVDKKKPTPYCISLSSAVMANGTVELWASDFDRGSFDNCTAKEDLLFTFDSNSPQSSKLNVEHFFKGAGQPASPEEYLAGDAQKWNPAVRSSAKIFNCDDLPSVDVLMSVWDEKGETDFCTVKLSLVDNQGACGNGMRVALSGQVVNTSGTAMSNVDVTLHNTLLSTHRTEQSDDNGIYTFDNVPGLLDYALSVAKDGDYMNGISTLDLVLIQRHILGLNQLNNPLKAIAADVNADGKIRTSDLVELRKLILGISEKFDNNSSWKFIDADQVFADANNPWPFNEVMELTHIGADKANINFKGQKVGDVNESAIANARSMEVTPRSSFTLVAQDTKVHSGEDVVLSFEAMEKVSTFGLQLSFKADDMLLEDITSDYFDVKGAFLVETDGTVRISLYSSEAIEIEAGKSILNLKFKNQKTGTLSEKMDFSKSVLTPEIYTSGLQTSSLQIMFRNIQSVEATTFGLFQNEPNPFADKTSIRYRLPDSGIVSLTIHDVTGRLIYNKEIKNESGDHVIDINRDIFPDGGVFYCKLEFNHLSSTIKMIHLK